MKALLSTEQHSVVAISYTWNVDTCARPLASKHLQYTVKYKKKHEFCITLITQENILITLTPLFIVFEIEIEIPSRHLQWLKCVLQTDPSSPDQPLTVFDLDFPVALWKSHYSYNLIESSCPQKLLMGPPCSNCTLGFLKQNYWLKICGKFK